MKVQINPTALAATGVLFLGEPVIAGCKAANDKMVRHYERRLDAARTLEMNAASDVTISETDFFKFTDATSAARKRMHRADTIHSWINGSLNFAGFGFGASALVAVVAESVPVLPTVLVATAAGAALYVIARALKVAGVTAYRKFGPKEAEKSLEDLAEQIAKPSRLAGARKVAHGLKVLLASVIEKIATTLEDLGFGSVARAIRSAQLVRPIMAGSRMGTPASAALVLMSASESMPTAAVISVVAVLDYLARAGVEVAVTDARMALLIAGGVATAMIVAFTVRKVRRTVREVSAAVAKTANEATHHLAEEAAAAEVATDLTSKVEGLLKAMQAQKEQADALLDQVTETHEWVTEMAKTVKTREAASRRMLKEIEQKEAASANLLRKVTAEYVEADYRSEQAKALLANAEAEARKMHARDKTGPTPKRPVKKAVPKAAGPAPKVAEATPATLPTPVPAKPAAKRGRPRKSAAAEQMDKAYADKVEQTTGLTPEQLHDAGAA